MANPTRFLLSASALLLGLMGLATTFAPQEILTALGEPQSSTLQLIVQLLGALYLGFAGLNWMVRGSIIGGIYNRPIVIGNLMHFLVGGLAVIREVSRAPSRPMLWIVAVIYATCALGFGAILFRHPVTDAHERTAR